jgi:hypothetical protein
MTGQSVRLVRGRTTKEQSDWQRRYEESLKRERDRSQEEDLTTGEVVALEATGCLPGWFGIVGAIAAASGSLAQATETTLTPICHSDRTSLQQSVSPGFGDGGGRSRRSSTNGLSAISVQARKTRGRCHVLVNATEGIGSQRLRPPPPKDRRSSAAGSPSRSNRTSALREDCFASSPHRDPHVRRPAGPERLPARHPSSRSRQRLRHWWQAAMTRSHDPHCL